MSGGIDSPVAGFMLARRGVEIDALHFFSPPYTGIKAREKVIELCKIVSKYSGKINLYIANFTEPQLAIRDNCPSEQMVLLMRRIMKWQELQLTLLWDEVVTRLLYEKVIR